MDIPMQIIMRYEPYRTSNNIFNIGSHDTINKRIKEVAKMCGIEKRTSFHLSRHTFAVLALNYGMPIERCKQDSRTYEHYHNADLRQGNKHQTRT